MVWAGSVWYGSVRCGSRGFVWYEPVRGGMARVAVVAVGPFGDGRLSGVWVCPVSVYLKYL